MNPTCPICPGPRALAKNGFNAKSGTQRYRCTTKGCTYSLSDSPHAQGRPTKWGKAMTDAERQAEYRVRQEEKKAIAPIDNQITSPRFIKMSQQNTESSFVKDSQLPTHPLDMEYCPGMNKSVSPLAYEERAIPSPVTAKDLNEFLHAYFSSGKESE